MPKDIPVRYEVEDSVPIPVHRAPYNAVPLSELEVGESILFPRADRSKVQTQASRLKKAKKGVFTIRVIDESHCRVWRTE